jgi:hypothetical protein
MTPEDKQKLKEHMRSISEILVKNTPSNSLKDFESIELAIREHLLTEIGPEIANFFWKQQRRQGQEELEK